jgi:hypothetical protein
VSVFGIVLNAIINGVIQMYKTMNGWTKQSMIDAIMKGNNGTKSLSPDDPNLCAYRGSNANKCAVGCFIPDDKYSDKMEGLLVGMVVQRHPHLADCFPIALQGLREMQRYHDGAMNEEDPREVLVSWINDNVEDVK